jgi:hypothetical protein
MKEWAARWSRSFQREISRRQQPSQADQRRAYLLPGEWLLHVRVTIMLLPGWLSCVDCRLWLVDPLELPLSVVLTNAPSRRNISVLMLATQPYLRHARWHWFGVLVFVSHLCWEVCESGIFDRPMFRSTTVVYCMGPLLSNSP